MKIMISIKTVPRKMKFRRQFRTLARDNCGESMEPGCDETIYFGYSPSDENQKENPIACASLLPAKESCHDFESRDFYHWVTYIFVNKKHKGEGHGSQLIQFLHHDAWFLEKRPIKADVAHKAVSFFEKNGYRIISEPWRPIAGSSYFRKLYPMQLDFKEPEEELWDV